MGSLTHPMFITGGWVPNTTGFDPVTWFESNALNYWATLPKGSSPNFAANIEVGLLRYRGFLPN